MVISWAALAISATGGKDASCPSWENRVNILFLQGPASPFLRTVADFAQSRGAPVRKLHFCIGDWLFWQPRNGDWFKERAEKWPQFLSRYIDEHGITDIVMLGDGRPKHATAARVAAEKNLRVHVLEHGYLRPDWLTLEPDGMSGNSRFPRNPEAIRELAETAPEPALGKRFEGSFLTYALYDLAFHLPNVFFGWLVHPHYRTHGPVHPLLEYAGWIGKALTATRRQRRAAQLAALYLGRYQQDAGYFIFPLQLPGDYQIRNHAPGSDIFPIIDATIASFARHAPAGMRLLFKVHPIDNGLSGWQQRIGSLAARLGVDDRIDVIDGGDLDKLISASRGVVTVNSTVGLTAVLAGSPVIALGDAIYDIDGLTHQESLASFWTSPAAPDPLFAGDFLKALIRTTQLRGGFIGREAILAGAEAVAERIVSEVDLLPKRSGPHQKPSFRYEDELAGETKHISPPD
jgi:capsular polysaccharide export protein